MLFHHHVLPNLTWIFIWRTFKIATSRFDINATNLGQTARKMTLNYGLFLTLKYVHQLYRPFFMVFCILFGARQPRATVSFFKMLHLEPQCEWKMCMRWLTACQGSCRVCPAVLPPWQTAVPAHWTCPDRAARTGWLFPTTPPQRTCKRRTDEKS